MQTNVYERDGGWYFFASGLEFGKYASKQAAETNLSLHQLYMKPDIISQVFQRSEQPEPLRIGPFTDDDLQQILSELPRGVGQLSGSGPLISAIHGSGYLRIRDVYIMLTPEQYELMQDSYEELC